MYVKLYNRQVDGEPLYGQRFFCNFTDSEGNADWCHFRQVDDDDADWRITNKPTPTFGTGPHYEKEHGAYIFSSSCSNWVILFYFSLNLRPVFSEFVYLFGVQHFSFSWLLSGYYLFMEASVMNPGGVARLRSPDLRFWYNRRCVMFQYSMRGRHVGRLEVRSDNNTLLFLKVGSK